MSDEEKNAGGAGVGAALSVPPEQPGLDDEHTTVPNPPLTNPDGKASTAAGGQWQMPKPKFQQTSGYLPQGYLKNMEEAAAAAKASMSTEDTTREQPPFVVEPAQSAADAPAIEPQPDLSEQLIPDDPPIETPSEPVQAKSSMSAVMAVLAIVGILIFVVVVLAAVYFYFIANQTAGSNF